MPRVLRSVLPDGYFHVYARGVADTDPFPEPADRAAFVALVRRAETRFELVVVALCVMSSHYHLIVRGSQAELSRAMQWINGTYARDFNKRNGKFGAVWAERFSCRAVEEETLATVYAYVMNNPVRAGLCATPEDWPWTYGRHGLGGSV